MADKWHKASFERISLGVHRYVGALAACVKFLLIYPWFRPGQTNQFAFGALTLNDKISYKSSLIPEKSLWEVFPKIEGANFELGKVLPPEESGILPFEMLTLAAMVKHLAPKTVFEIGTSTGVTSYSIAINQPENGRLLTLDLPPATAESLEIPTKFRVTISDRKMIFANRES
jgi:hypothetical protein